MTASEREALVVRVRGDLGKAIGGLPLPWGNRELDAPLARVTDAIDAICAEVERLTRERDALLPVARLGLAALDAMRDDSPLDGFDVQDTAEEFGVIKGQPAEKPSCGECCACAEYDSDVCFRDTPETVIARTAIDAARTTGGRDA